MSSKRWDPTRANYEHRINRFLSAAAKRRASKSPIDEEEVLQEAWLRVAKNRKSCETASNTEAWLESVARSAFIDLYRKRSKQIAFDRCLRAEASKYDCIAYQDGRKNCLEQTECIIGKVCWTGSDGMTVVTDHGSVHVDRVLELARRSQPSRNNAEEKKTVSFSGFIARLLDELEGEISDKHLATLNALWVTNFSNSRAAALLGIRSEKMRDRRYQMHQQILSWIAKKKAEGPLPDWLADIANAKRPAARGQSKWHLCADTDTAASNCRVAKRVAFTTLTTPRTSTLGKIAIPKRRLFARLGRHQIAACTNSQAIG